MSETDVDRPSPPPGPPSPTEAKRLWGWASWDEAAHSAVPQLVFGELVSLATPVVERFRSDLYHDAMWLHRELPAHFAGDVEESFEFTYAVSEYGTSIGTNAQHVSWRAGGPADKVYRVIVSTQRGAWYFHAEEITDA